MLKKNLIFILGMVLLFSFGCQKPPLPKFSKLPPQEKKEEKPEDTEMDYLLKELKQKNPFRPDHAVGLAIEPEGNGGLKGIIWDSQRPYAIIGDKVVIEGDYLDNKKVLKINKNSVVLDNNGRQEVLKIEEPTEEVLSK